MTQPVVVVIGDALLDRDVVGDVERLAPDAPVAVVDQRAIGSRPGGAGLAAALLARDGVDVTLITAVGRDAAGSDLRALLAGAGVRIVDLGGSGETPEKIRIRAQGRSLVRVDRGRAGDAVGHLDSEGSAALDRADAVLVSDYGRGVTFEPSVREAVESLSPRVPVVWDPHPRGARPVANVRLATPNRAEAESFARDGGPNGAEAGLLAGGGAEGSLASVTASARALSTRWRAASVSVTLGERGALLVEGPGAPLVVPAATLAGADPCGAGDRFASAATESLASGLLPSEAVAVAVTRATAFVAAGGAETLNSYDRPRPAEDSSRLHGTPVRSISPANPPARSSPAADAFPALSVAGASAAEVVSTVRAAGGTVVATGGCFDLLHAGHIATLRAARSLGDCLIVCLNSDDSVRRIKGPDRPLVPEADRAAVLAALDSVDAVVCFDEDTPEAVLEEIRPDVFAKGGDYRVGDLPEAQVVGRWGGQTVVLPYLEGRSTTRLLKEARRGGY